MRAYVKRNKRLVWFSLFLLGAAFAFLWIIDGQRDNLPPELMAVLRPGMIAGGTLLLALLMAGLHLANARGWKPERMFLLLFVPLSILTMAVIPPGRVQDELRHFERSYLIADGQAFPANENGKVVVRLPDNFFRGLRIEESDYQPTDEELAAFPDLPLTALTPDDYWNHRVFPNITLQDVASERDLTLTADSVPYSSYAGTGIYPLTAYVPQALGIRLLLLFTRNRLALFWGARLMNWLLVALLLYYAVKKLPGGKHVLTMISLSPLLLQEAISVSADGTAFALVAAIVAFVLSARQERKPFRAGQYAALALLVLGVMTFKFHYCLFALLPLGIPAECFGGKKRRGLALAAILGGSLLLLGGWGLYILRTYFARITVGRGSSSGAMLASLAQSPLSVALVLVRTMVKETADLFDRMCGSLLGWDGIFVPSLIYFGVGLTYAYTFAFDRGLADRRGVRWGLLLATAGSLLVIMLSMYIWEAQPGDTILDCMQGRYLLPLMLPLALGAKKAPVPLADGAYPALPVAGLAMAALDLCAMAAALMITIM